MPLPSRARTNDLHLCLSAVRFLTRGRPRGGCGCLKPRCRDGACRRVGVGSWRDRSVLAKERQPQRQDRPQLTPCPRSTPRRTRQRLLKRTGKALERIILDPWRIGAITTTALVL